MLFLFSRSDHAEDFLGSNLKDVVVKISVYFHAVLNVLIIKLRQTKTFEYILFSITTSALFEAECSK